MMLRILAAMLAVWLILLLVGVPTLGILIACGVLLPDTANGLLLAWAFVPIITAIILMGSFFIFYLVYYVVIGKEFG